MNDQLVYYGSCRQMCANTVTETDDYPNYYQGSCNIKNITYGRLHHFLNDNDIAVVMYYNPSYGACKAAKEVYQTAAQITDRPDTAFGAVNCGHDREVCIKEDAAFDLPQIKAYAFGKILGQFEYSFHMTGQEIARWVEELPVPLHASTPTALKRFY